MLSIAPGCGGSNVAPNWALASRKTDADQKQTNANRRRFLGCAAGALALGAAPIREEPESVIPLKTLAATSGQEGLIEFPWGRKSDDLRRLVDPRKIGPANLFLVVGKDLDAALDATCGAFLEGASVERPVIRPGDEQTEASHLWAVFYFGSAQSSPSEWTVTRAAVQRGRVRVTVSRPKPDKLWRLFDRRVYMLWVPLGERKEGACTLEAYDETNRSLMMTRRVLIPTP